MVRAIMIVEMAGSPAEHVKDTLSKHILILEKVNDIKVHSIKISEPKEIEESKGVFTCFAEADFETESFSRLSETVFDFMPSSVEVIEPGKVTMDLHEASSLLNNISGRMHRYDEIAKIAHFRIKQLKDALDKKGLKEDKIEGNIEENKELTTKSKKSKKKK